MLICTLVFCSPQTTFDTPRFKLTPERASPLQKWFDDHKDHPYPTRHDKMMLCRETQLTFTQVYMETHTHTHRVISCFNG